MYTTAWLLICIGCFTTSAENQPNSPKNDPIRIEIWKEARSLRILEGQYLVADYPIGLGFNPVGHKERQGDGATPEGSYEICIKNPFSQFYLSLGINFPNLDDANHGFEKNIVDQVEKERIHQSLSRGDCPPWNTGLGGEIFIHGRGSGEDWTLGCIALEDDAMKNLYDLARVGTEVTIYP